MKRSLQPTQTFYLNKTQEKVTDFSKAVQRFQKKFESKGPGSVGEDLDSGVGLLKVRLLFNILYQAFSKRATNAHLIIFLLQEYSKKVVELLREREQLDQEEDVFDLPATQYPGLDNAVVVMQQLREVFVIYQQLKVSITDHFLHVCLLDLTAHPSLIRYLHNDICLYRV